MWIEDKNGNAYNLDYALAVKLHRQGEQDKTWEVVAVMTRQETVTRIGEAKNVIVLLSTDNEQKARDFFANVKARLGLGSE
jgi:hypothetical protein